MKKKKKSRKQRNFDAAIDRVIGELERVVKYTFNIGKTKKRDKNMTKIS